MAGYGQTANGMAHFAPMMGLEAPQLNIGNPFKDYIAQAIAERELELKEKGLGLDEQKLAYGAANDEANREHARALAELGIKGAKDNINLKYNRIEKIGDKANKLTNGAYDYVGELLKEYSEKVKSHIESGNTDPMIPFNDFALANPKFKAGMTQYGGENMFKALGDITQQGIINTTIGTSNIGLNGTYRGKSKNTPPELIIDKESL
ncbi:hypothetical protein [Campylobacter sp.]